MNLVLIGYRGTAEFHVARLLGRSLSMPVVSLDEVAQLFKGAATT